MAPHSPGLLSAIGLILRESAVEAENLGTKLCEDPDFLAKNIEQLQGVDRLSQVLTGLGELLESAEPEAAIEAIRLGEIRDRLTDVEEGPAKEEIMVQQTY